MKIKKKKLIEYLRILETIDFSSSEYEFQFFTKFNNNKLFFILNIIKNNWRD